MDRLFWGFLVLFLNFSLQIGDYHSINLLPPWLGYILLAQAALALQEESPLFARPRPLCFGVAVYTGLLWLTDLLGIMRSFNWGSWVLALLSTALELYISYLFVQAIRDVELRRSIDLQGDSLQRVWMVSAVATALSNFLLPFGLPILFILISLGAAIAFLVVLNRTRKAYRQPLGL